MIIDVLILVKGVLVSSTPGTPPWRARADASLSGSGGQLPRMPSTQEQAHAGHKLSAPAPGLPMLPRGARVAINGAPGSPTQHQTL
jgi:hypothetical protein